MAQVLGWNDVGRLGLRQAAVAVPVEPGEQLIHELGPGRIVRLVADPHMQADQDGPVAAQEEEVELVGRAHRHRRRGGGGRYGEGQQCQGDEEVSHGIGTP